MPHLPTKTPPPAAAYLLPSGVEAADRRIADALRRSLGDGNLEILPGPGARAPAGQRVFVPWLGRPFGIGPVAAMLRHRGRGNQLHWVDTEGAQGPCSIWSLRGEILRLTLLRAGGLLLGGLRHLLPAPGAVDQRPGQASQAGGRDLLLLPVLPDLSHTFVYREVQAVLDSRPNTGLICLEEGQAVPEHPEARALRERCAFLPRRGLLGRFGAILGFWLRHPRRSARLLQLYGPNPSRLWGKRPLQDPRHPGRAFELAAMLQREDLRSLHVYGSTYACNVALGAAILLDLPFSISSYVDFDFAYEDRMLAEKYRLSRFFRVCTKFCQNRILELLPEATAERVPVIYWGLDLQSWQDRAAPAGRGCLVSACRLVAKKGLHLVPPALRQLREQGVHCRWIVFGSGPEQDRLKALCAAEGIEDLVEFRGPQGNDQVRATLRQADLALLPCVVAEDGERDGIPIFLIEAMALGLPILTSPVSGIPELVRDGETGFLSPSGDAAALASQLARILGDAELRQRVGAAGRAEVHASQDVQHSATQLWQQLDGAVS